MEALIKQFVGQFVGKKIGILFCLILINITPLRATPITQVDGVDVVEQWGIFEVALDGPSDGNPFLDVQLSAQFTNGVITTNVDGFYDGAGKYKIRFMPQHTGQWRFITQSNRWSLTAKKGNFEAVVPTKDNHGPVGVVNTFHFAYADGTPFKQIGTTSYTWTHRPAEVEQQTLDTLANSPFNKLRFCVFPQTHGIETMPPQRFPFAGEPTKPDYSRFNPAFFQHLENHVDNLRQLNIEADLILLQPYDDKHIWGLDNMPAEVEDRYLRYIVARLAAYRNIWWSMANEYDFLRTKTEADWDRIFQVVQQADPYDHLRSIHNGKKIYNNTKPWVTHASIQNGFAVTNPGTAQLYRDVYNKPIVYDEVEYEGNHGSRWAQLSGKELVHRFWSGTVVGTYVGHSEFLVEANDPSSFVWLGQGGILKGESPVRLAFLRQILEDSPAEGIEPIDKWWNPNIGGQAGEYYLIYFGHERLNQWQFALPPVGLTEGDEFKVEVIDTWNMTIEPVAGVFKVKRDGRYHFRDINNKQVKLPKKTGLALRIKRISNAN
ncbi:MAG: DUF5060 domain-containing protein [Paraglaciecola sp.]|uniref:DUF5060 domain-containing protein n=1 Tax=Paraglaciecola sp. TaxID=1920173 RepID=UPI0032997140